ncbi:MAG TPA: type II toxin-antitoxin system VapC family toxin [Gemmataceae bacterium]|nr:type II toxin-antitoxin system VapC family toxin [Gemmataceae bacterium]
MKFLLDTDHISFLQAMSGPEYVTLSTRISRHSPADFAFSLVSFHEQMLGCYTRFNRARTTPDVVRAYELLDQVFQSYRRVAILQFDAAAGAVFDGLAAQRIRVGTMDLRIASIALSRGLTVLTRNLRDFRRMPNLLAEDWTV